ncbi:MAG: HDIG domain-containing metalloprotein [bacterium]
MAQGSPAPWFFWLLGLLAVVLAAVGPVLEAQPTGPLAVRLALMAGVLALVVWIVTLLKVRRRRASLLLLLPAMSALAAHLVKIQAGLPAACAPLALGALLAGLTLGRRSAVLVGVTTLALAGLAGAVAGATLMGVGAGVVVSALLTLPRRTSVVVPAALAGAVVQAGVLFIVAPVRPPSGLELGGFDAAFGGAGAVVAGVAALLLAWPVQRWAGVSSARRLRRLSAPWNPLMRELRRRAPGTYRHARNVAFLTEAGGRALGGDLALLRAGAWVHDLGKLFAPEAFAENRRPEAGEADLQLALSPEQSALRISRHVADGLRLARRYRLPGELRELIAQHHGTSGLHGPMHRAAQQGRDIDPAVYYYPGPLPRSREAAILMVSDAVEAASRRIDDPSLAAVAAVVEEVVERLMSEYQFEDCDVTQVELVRLQETLVLTLRHSLHRRGGLPDQGALQP